MNWFFLSLYFALASSINTAIVKKLLGPIHPLVLLLVINLFTLPFVFVIVYFSGGIPKISTLFYPLITASAILDVIAFTASFWAMRISPISLISPISSFNPVFVTLISMITLGEIPSERKFLGILIIVLGVYLLNVGDIKTGFLSPLKNLLKNRGVQLFFLANFIWGITPTFQKKAIFQTDPIMPVFPSFFGIVLLILFIFPFAIGKTKNYKLAIKQNIIWFLAIGLLASLAQLAAYTAFLQTNVGYATAIFKTSTLFTILFGWWFFKEKRIKERLLGASVMILGTILLVI